MIPLIEQMNRLSERTNNKVTNKTIKGFVCRKKPSLRNWRHRRRPITFCHSNKFCLMRYKFSF